MNAFRRISHPAGKAPSPEEDSPPPPTSRRHRHLHHHHHKDYAVSPTGGNRPITIPPANEERHRRHKHRHRRRRSESRERPAAVIGPEQEPEAGSSSSSSSGSGGSVTGVKIPQSGLVERRRRRATTASDQAPPPTPVIKTTPPTPSPLGQAHRSNSHPVRSSTGHESLPYPVTPRANNYTLELSRDPADLFPDPADHRSKRYSAPVAQEYKDRGPRGGAVEIGSSDSIQQPPRRSNSTAAAAATKTAAAASPAFARSRGSVRENRYDFLNAFDTAFVIDDSGSMSEHDYWSQLRIALETLVAVAGRYDADGIDIHFLNAAEHDRANVTDTKQISRAFEKVQPRGVTPTGACLDRILRSYLDKYAAVKAAYAQAPAEPNQPTLYSLLPKPLNIIVLTDGEPTDDPESVIVAAARALDKLNAPLHQVGIQFVQIGNEEGAREGLEELDDRLEEIYGVRDMVDFTPFVPAENGPGVTGEVILKALLGAVNRRYDRWRNP